MSVRLKLVVGALFVSSAVGYLALIGASNSWQYYLSVDEIVADAPNLTGKRIRVNGRVAIGSLKISERRREAEFELAGVLHQLHASCRCAMPDNLAEDIDIVVEGVLQADGILGHKIITRCASKYQPKKAAAARNDSSSTPVFR